MTPSGRTNWLPKDTGWWRRERIVTLGLEFGADGPAVIDWLTCEAKMQNDSGWVKSGNLAISHGCFVELVRVCPILSRSVQLGLLDDFEGSETGFTCRISGWRDDQEKPLAAAKKAAQRAEASTEKPRFAGRTSPGHNGTDGDTSPLVPIRPEMSPTEQNIKEQEELPPGPQGGDNGLVAPRKPNGNRARDLAAYQEQLEKWVGEHFPGCLPKSVSMVASVIRTEGREPTPDAIREFAATHPNFAALLESAA